MKLIKHIALGFANFLLRFIVGGLLYEGMRMDAEGLIFGFLITLTSFSASYLLFKRFIKPNNRKYAVQVSITWILIALMLDILTAGPILHIPATYLLSQPQVWIRLAAIPLAAIFSVYKNK